ncbi:folylpolyglutamate synthase/dihydrofolate synthase family protein [Lysobacter sp. M2-1]|uniref:bifunctional folylpolyglutamate synthase/dihydrofolate synthase n=1 Tax=Lysobacter sp. M2-1 TaxID=2916839 RepID=UPI001F591E18|nr:folylpolyglutamate synthase/dihydrofolate synthase family protein [Lysobacter sp. M2-1]
MTRTLADWLDYIEAQHPKSIDMGLDRVREVARRMQLAKPARHVITVAGTNGKGSTVAFVESIALAAGWKVGAYTSPHLLRYNERVRIGGVEAADADLVAAFEAVEAARLGRPPGAPDRMSGETTGAAPAEQDRPVSLTYFEYGTLAALWLFGHSGLDLAILEVGLGGRLDATNLIDPDVAVVTTVDLDHQDWLGAGREAIGLEKAGIARAWKPLVLGEDDPPASVLRHAYAIGAPAIRAGCDFFVDPPAEGVGTWRWRELGFELELPMPPLAAPVQLRNAATAIAALRSLDEDIPDEAFMRGVAQVHINARLQRFALDGIEVLVDVGHNPQAARELAAALLARPCIGRTIAVYAALADKDHAAVVAGLAAQVDAWLLASSLAAGARGLGADELASRLAGTPAASAERYVDVATALHAARAQARAGDRILVFGSFHAAAEALQALNRT